MILTKRNLSLLVCSVLLGCAPFKTPQFRMPSLLDVEVLKWDGNKPTIRTKAVCYNQNHLGFQFKGGEVTIFLDTLRLGKALIDTTFYVPAQSEFTVPANLKIDLAYLSTHGLKLDSTMVTLDGKFKGSIAGISKTININYKGLHNINLIMEPF